MANQTFSLSDNTVSIVSANETALEGLKGDAKQVTEQVNATKLATYAELISAISGVTLTKGNLPRTISKTVRNRLTTGGGCKDAVAKKYIENSVGAKRQFGFGDNTTPTAVLAVFADQGITSEAKLAKAVSGEAEKSAALILAEKVMGKWSTSKDDNGNVVQGKKFKDGLDDEELAVFFDELHALQAARNNYHNDQAAKAAQAAVEKENETVNDVVDQF
ncbi:MAG: hypothetical protein CMF27_07655 [Kiritimatiellaceae bacterium]|nr:hypothetical protein [Kiritimatiellaceae bacterium]|tara:strand:- start:375 stop:1031 length:657 start_codon:yes stop_codon:yes gene_type:complete